MVKKTPRATGRRARITVQKKKSKASEVSSLGKALRMLGGLGGGSLGAAYGAPGLGTAAGSQLGALVSRWLGAGDYSIKENSIITQNIRGTNSIPDMHKSGQSIVVRHKEFIAQVNGSTGFTVGKSLVLNPGLASTFPWLSGIASQFEQYKIKGLVFHYIPTSGSAINSTNPAIGSVMLQTNYRSVRDPVNAAPLRKEELLNEYWSCEAAPNEAFCHPIECDPAENPFQIHYVRTNPVPEDDSPLMYDYGTTFVATSGMPASGNAVGDLWMTYEVELLKPIVASPVTTGLVQGKAGVSPNNLTPFGDANTKSLGSLRFALTGQWITFEPGATGKFLIMVSVLAASPANNKLLVDTRNNCTLTRVFSDGAQTTFATTAIPADGELVVTFGVEIVNPTLPTSVKIVYSSAVTFVTYSGVFITKMD